MVEELWDERVRPSIRPWVDDRWRGEDEMMMFILHADYDVFYWDGL